MAGKGYFMCRGEDHHILIYDIPDGVTVGSFAERASCKEYGERVDIAPDNV